jgi:hypothetical protein
MADVLEPIIDRGSGTGALTALAALGAQDEYMWGGQSIWTPVITQHTPFTITQRLVRSFSKVSGYLGNTVQMDLFPRESGDLITNMYIKCALPALPSGNVYTELIGRALVDKAEFLVDGEVYETITDDWYMIHDQLFLDADEKLGLYQLVSKGTVEGTDVSAGSQIDLLIPLDFFFCHRFTHAKKRDKPFFPMCAIGLSTVSIRITFNTQAWVTNYTGSIDILDPKLLVEEVWLGREERELWKNTPLTFKIPRAWREAKQEYNNGVAKINLTPNFPVSMMVWFVRNKKYEQQDRNYYSSRYAYGYTTKYIKATTPVTFFNGVQLNYIDTIDYATIFFNNNNILSNFPGGLYYTFKQPIDHGLAIPTKSLYMYCFSEKPHEYVQSGALDFSKYNSQTTFLNIKFNSQYASQIESEFSLNMYYYGYITLQISDGKCKLL